MFNGIRIYQFTFEFYTSVSGCGVVSDLNKNIGGSTDLAKKKMARIGGFVYPYRLPSTLNHVYTSNSYH